MIFINAHQFHKLGCDQRLQCIPKAHRSSVMEIVPDEGNYLIQNKVGCDKLIAVV